MEREVEKPPSGPSAEELFQSFLLRRYEGAAEPTTDFLAHHEALREPLEKLLHEHQEAEKAAPVEAPENLGDFQILEEIGRGGMGVVYRARQVSLNREVALKVLPSHLAFSSRALARFQREAEAAGRQNHPGIVTVYAFGSDRNCPYIAQELVEGGNLSQYLLLLRLQPAVPRDHYKKCAEMVLQIADAMQSAHESGVIHRDMKPSNVLLTPSMTPKVTDFGLAKVEDALELSRTGDFSGTPFYMSPEQAVSRRIGIDARTDVFSLGVTLYELLTLQRPFDGDTSHQVIEKIVLEDPVQPDRLRSQLPHDLSTICLKALEKKRERRYQTMGELADDLRRFLRGEAIQARPPSLAYRAQRWCARHPTKAVSIALGIVALTITTFLTVSLLWEQQRRERLSDLALVRRLVSEAEGDALWPAHPRNLRAYASWLEKARDLVSRGPSHRERLDAVVAKLPEFTAGAVLDTSAGSDQARELWTYDTLAELVDGLDRLSAPQAGLIADIERRREHASTLEERSIRSHAAEWEEAIFQIGESHLYGGLALSPQIGLVPLAVDPDSGLWEFWVLESGERPVRDPDSGRYEVGKETAVVLVLLPAGSFWMGASKDEDDPQYDHFAQPWESPVHETSVPAYFLSKYELTQGQWLRCMGTNPSSFAREDAASPGALPVTDVSWDDCRRALGRWGLRLPREAEWEYAARGGRETPPAPAELRAMLRVGANLADQAFIDAQNNVMGRVVDTNVDWSDEFARIAPVGHFAANSFGVHDLLGNVWEWCFDAFAFYGTPGVSSEQDSRTSGNEKAIRGGAWCNPQALLRPTQREFMPAVYVGNDLGVRAARSLDPAPEE